MNKQVGRFYVLSVRRGNNSYYGNPSYYLVLRDRNGNLYTAKTVSNGAISYSISYLWERTYKMLRFHFTSSGNMMIDSLA